MTIKTFLLALLTFSTVSSFASMPDTETGNTATRKPASKVDRMFPDGTVHDFGRVVCGDLRKHSFRIVNTCGLPLRIVNARCSWGALRVVGSTTELLQPGETGKVEVAFDTRRFRGRKIQSLYLTTSVREVFFEQTVFTIKADARDPWRLITHGQPPVGFG